MVMFYAFRGISEKITDMTDGAIYYHMVALIAFGLAVLKSGAWSKKICGTS